MLLFWHNICVRVNAELFVAEISRSHGTASPAPRPQLHEMRVALEFHEGGEEDVHALDDVVVHRNVHHSAHLRFSAGRKQISECSGTDVSWPQPKRLLL